MPDPGKAKFKSRHYAVREAREILGADRFDDVPRWEIYRALSTMGYSLQAIAKIFGVSKTAVYKAVSKYSQPPDMALVTRLENAGIAT